MKINNIPSIPRSAVSLSNSETLRLAKEREETERVIVKNLGSPLMMLIILASINIFRLELLVPFSESNVLRQNSYFVKFPKFGRSWRICLAKSAHWGRCNSGFVSTPNSVDWRLFNTFIGSSKLCSKSNLLSELEGFKCLKSTLK